MRAHVVVVMFACACGPGSAAMAARHAEADLRCPFEEIEAYHSPHGTFVARGCGKWAEYSCVSVFDRWSGERSATCNLIAVHTPR